MANNRQQIETEEPERIEPFEQPDQGQRIASDRVIKTCSTPSRTSVTLCFPTKIGQ